MGDLLTFVGSHPVVSVVLLLVGGWSLGGALSAPVTAWRKWKRPGGLSPVPWNGA